MAIVIIERNKVIAYLFDADFNKKASLETDNLKNKFNEVIGYSIDDLKYDVLYSNTLKDKFAILSIDFAARTMTTSEVKIDRNDAIYVDAVGYKNNLYLFTTGDHLKLKIHAYDRQQNFKVVKTFNLDEVKDKSLLIQSKNKVGTFRLAVAQTSGVKKINQHTPNAIDDTSSPSKLYQLDNQVYLTLDGEDSGTSLYDIDLETFSVNFKTFSYPKGKLGDFKKYNSFLYDDMLFQIASSKDEMSFIIKTLSGELIKEFYVHKDQPITFKNSGFIQEGTAIPFIAKRELEETKKYLRKITNGDLGITVLKNKGFYYVTLGGFDIISKSKYPTPMMSMPMTTTTFAGTQMAYNSVNLSYGSYTSTKSVYFDAIFDLNFNHMEGEFETNVFDKIKSYQDALKHHTAEDVFYYNKNVFLGYMDLKESEYNLIKF